MNIHTPEYLKMVAMQSTRVAARKKKIKNPKKERLINIFSAIACVILIIIIIICEIID